MTGSTTAKSVMTGGTASGDRFDPQETPLAGLLELNRKRIGDERGFFSRLFCATDLFALSWRRPVAQINESLTAKAGTVRGMHFQHPPFAEMKLVTCTAGRVLDVAVDIRKGSPTFLQSYGVELSAENGKSLLIPEGFAHGFQALEDGVRLVYACSAPYTPEAEAGLHCADPALGLAWPLPVVHLSPRDAAHATLPETFRGIEL